MFSKPSHRGAFTLVLLLLALAVYSTLPRAAEANPACGSTLATSTVLTADLNCASGFAGIVLTLAADDITLDGGGFSINAPDAGTGIYVPGRSGVTVTNVSVNSAVGVNVTGGGANEITGVETSWDGASPGGYGFYLASTSNNTTTNSTSTNRVYGVYITGDSDGSTVAGNRITGGSYGVFLTGDTDGNSIEANDLSGNTNAIYATSSTGQGNSYVDNDLSSSGGWSIRIGYDLDFTVSGNDMTGSAYGIGLENMDGVSLSGADVDLSGIGAGYGVYLANVTNSTVSDITTGAAVGVFVAGGGGNEISGVEASWDGATAGGTGFLFSSSSNNTTTNSTSTNRVYGLFITGDSDGNAVAGNRVAGSTYGVYLTGATDGNRIEGNDLSDNLHPIRAWESTGQGNAYIDNDLSDSTGWSILIANDVDFMVSGNDMTGSVYGIGLRDLDGVSLSGADVDLSGIGAGFGVYLLNVTNSTVSGITSGAATGVYVTGGGGNEIVNVDASWGGATAGGYGVRLSNTSNNTTTNSTSTNHVYGLYMDGDSDGNTFMGNRVTATTYGVYMAGSTDGNTIEGNDLSGNVHAIYAWTSTGQGNTYIDNDLSGSSGWSLYLGHDVDFTVSGNDLTGSEYGIALGNMDGVSLSDANVDLSSIGIGYGVYLVEVTNSTVSGITTSAATGVYVAGGSGNEIVNVEASWGGAAASGYGIRLANTSNNTTTNSTTTNRSYGVYISGASPGNSVTCSSVAGNIYGVFFTATLGSTTTLIGLNRIEGNSTYGVYNAVAGVLNAETNYWGKSDGAQGPGLSGSGDWVTVNVDALPFVADTQDLAVPCGDNTPPIADAGSGQTVEWTAGVTVIGLDGSGSSDPEDDPLTFEWSIVGAPAGSSATLDDAGTSSPSLNADALGTYTIELSVDDGNGESDTDTVAIDVEDTTAPQVSAALVPVDPKNKKGLFRVEFA